MPASADNWNPQTPFLPRFWLVYTPSGVWLIRSNEAKQFKKQLSQLAGSKKVTCRERFNQMFLKKVLSELVTWFFINIIINKERAGAINDH